MRQTGVTVCLRLAGAGVARSGSPRFGLRVDALRLSCPTLLRLHGVLLVVRTCIALLSVVGVVAILWMLRILVVASIGSCTGHTGTGTGSASSAPGSTIVNVLVVVGLLRHFVSHIVHLNLVDVGDTATFGLCAAGASSSTTVDGLGARLVDVVVLLTERKPLDLLGLFGTSAQWKQDEPDQYNETSDATSDTTDDSAEVGIRTTAGAGVGTASCCCSRVGRAGEAGDESAIAVGGGVGDDDDGNRGSGSGGSS